MLVDKIRKELTPYPMAFRAQLMKPSFAAHKQKWFDIETLLLVAMLYHSDSLADCQKFVETELGEEKTRTAEVAQLCEEFTLIGRQVNIVINWMLNRLSGQTEYHMVIEDLVSLAQTMIDSRVEEKEKQDRELELMRQSERETKLYEAMLIK